MRPPVLYFGGKARIADRIVALFPPHLHYVEPYAGSLSVLLAKYPSRMETVNDLDRNLMTWWRILRERPADLELACALTPHSRAEYEACLNAEPTDDDLEVARRVWVRLTQGRGGQLRRPTGWRYFAAADSLSMPGFLDAYRSRFAPVADRLRGVSIECRDALDVIAEYGRYPETLLYVDPPYPGSTRSSGNNYAHEMRGDAEHRDLAKHLRAARAAVLLSGYACDLYDLELYPDWSRHEIGATDGRNGERTEVLWSNRPLGQQLELFEGATS